MSTLKKIVGELWLCSLACIALFQSCGVSEALENIEENDRISDYADWLDKLNVNVSHSNLWEMEVWFPEQAYGRHLTFLLSENWDAERGIEIPVSEGNHPLKGLKGNTEYYYCLRSDSVSVKSMVRSFTTPYFSPVSLGLTVEEDRVRCDIYTDIPKEYVVEKGFYSELDESWKYVVEGDDFCIPIDSTLTSITGYLIQKEGISVSHANDRITPRFSPIKEVRRANGLLLQYEVSGALSGDFEILYTDGDIIGHQYDRHVQRLSNNSCRVTFDPPHFPITVLVRPRAAGFYGEEYVLNPIEE